jgi:hypothetical protein
MNHSLTQSIYEVIEWNANVMPSKAHKNAYLGPELTFTLLGTLWCAQPQIQRRLCETPIYVHCTFEIRKNYYQSP